MTKTEKTYGAWKVTEREYQAACKTAKHGTGVLSEGAYQVVRYCEGQIFVRDDAEDFLRSIREPQPRSDPRKVTVRGVDYWRSAKEMARKQKSAPANHGSLPSGESDPSVTLDHAGADTENPPRAWLEAKAEIDAGWPDKTA